MLDSLLATEMRALRGGGSGFVLLALSAFLSSVISSFLGAVRATPLDLPQCEMSMTKNCSSVFKILTCSVHVQLPRDTVELFSSQPFFSPKPRFQCSVHIEQAKSDILQYMHAG